MISIFGYGISFFSACYDETGKWLEVFNVEYKYESLFSLLLITATSLTICNFKIIVPVGNRGNWKWGWK